MDRLRIASCIDYCHPTGVVKPVQKDTHKYGSRIRPFRLFVLAPYGRRQNEQTTKLPRNIKLLICRGYLFVLSFVRFFDFHKAPKRTNDNATKWSFAAISFRRLFVFVALYKSLNRRNEISFWRLFVLSSSIRRQNEQTKWPYPASIHKPTCTRCIKFNSTGLTTCSYIIVVYESGVYARCLL